MATLSVHFAAAAQTDRGRKRPSNEDAFGYSVEHGIFVVCDGMGGAAAGEIASALAVEEVLAYFTQFPASSAPLQEAAAQAICQANAAIHSRSIRNPKLNGMGTTLVALLADGNRVLLANVGDSRCYLLRGQSMQQMTLDHSLVEEQVRMGHITPAEALRSPLRNVITRALGTQDVVTPDLFELEAQPGDLFLLCSDGLTRELTDPQIASALAQALPLEHICGHLVEGAKKAGGQDNITCILVRAEA